MEVSNEVVADDVQSEAPVLAAHLDAGLEKSGPEKEGFCVAVEDKSMPRTYGSVHALEF